MKPLAIVTLVGSAAIAITAMVTSVPKQPVNPPVASAATAKTAEDESAERGYGLIIEILLARLKEAEERNGPAIGQTSWEDCQRGLNPNSSVCRCQRSLIPDLKAATPECMDHMSRAMTENFEKVKRMREAAADHGITVIRGGRRASTVVMPGN